MTPECKHEKQMEKSYLPSGEAKGDWYSTWNSVALLDSGGRMIGVYHGFLGFGVLNRYASHDMHGN